jgi:hypothetical protein
VAQAVQHLPHEGKSLSSNLSPIETTTNKTKRGWGLGSRGRDLPSMNPRFNLQYLRGKKRNILPFNISFRNFNNLYVNTSQTPVAHACNLSYLGC